MAYAYPQIDELMGQQPQKQNIFQPTANQEAGGAANQQGGAVKTSAEGEVGASAGGGSLAAASSAPRVADTGVNAQNRTAQAAFKANQGKVQNPAAIQRMQSQIGTANTALAQQASDYAAKQAASHNYALDQGIAQKAIEDQAATEERGKVGGLLGKGMADQVENFNPTNVNVDTDLLNTNAGVKQLVSQGRRPTYGSNMAAFDAMLLQADPNFQRQVGTVKAQNAALRKNVSETDAASEAAAQTAAEQNLKTSQEDIQKYLLGYQGNITAEQKAAAEAANASLPGQIEAIRAQTQAALIDEQRKKAQAALDAQFQPGRASSQLAAIQADPSQYIDWLKGYDPTGSQFVTQTQAQRFNNIAGLLGQGGQTQVAAGDLPELYSARGGELYDKLVNEAGQARQTQDAKNQAEINAIMTAAQRAAEADNARRLSLTSSYGTDATKAAQALLGSKASSLVGNPFTQAGYTPEMQQAVMNSFSTDYLKKNPVAGFGTTGNARLSGTELLTQAQADQLNALAKDTGLASTYQGGQYAAGGPQSFVNQESIQNALLSYIKNIKDSQSAQARYDAANPRNPTAGTLIVPDTQGPGEYFLPGQLNKPKPKIDTSGGGGIINNGPYGNIKSNRIM